MIDYSISSVRRTESVTTITYTIYRGDIVTEEGEERWKADALPIEQGHYDLQEVLTDEEAGEDLKAYAQYVAESRGDVLRP